MDIKQTAKEFQVTHLTVRNWIKKGCPHDFVYTGMRKRYEFDKLAVRRWLKEQKRGMK